MFKWLLNLFKKQERNSKGQFVKGHTYIEKKKKGKKYGRANH